MPSTFDKALRDGITMLISLPRDRSRAWSATARIERFRKKHPNAGATLLLDQPPGSLRSPGLCPYLPAQMPDRKRGPRALRHRSGAP